MADELAERCATRAPGVGWRGASLVVRAIDRLALGCAYLSGMLFVLAALYLTVDVIGRRFFGVSSGMVDEFSGYALLAGGLFSLGYTLRRGQHVRVDILLHKMPKPVRITLNFAALLLMALFGLLFSIYSWRLALESYEMQARAVSFIGTPLVIPQALMALGFCVLTLQAIAMLLTREAWSVEAGAPPPARPAEGATVGRG